MSFLFRKSKIIWLNHAFLPSQLYRVAVNLGIFLLIATAMWGSKTEIVEIL